MGYIYLVTLPGTWVSHYLVNQGKQDSEEKYSSSHSSSYSSSYLLLRNLYLSLLFVLSSSQLAPTRLWRRAPLLAVSFVRCRSLRFVSNFDQLNPCLHVSRMSRAARTVRKRIPVQREVLRTQVEPELVPCEPTQ